MRYPVSELFGKTYFTKLRSFVKKRHDVVIQPEVYQAGGRKRVETYGVDLFERLSSLC